MDTYVHVDEQTSRIVLHRQVLRHLGDDDRADSARVGVRLNDHGRTYFAALAGPVREADQDHVTPFPDFPGTSSYSSVSSHPVSLPAAQARAWSSSRVQGL